MSIAEINSDQEENHVPSKITTLWWALFYQEFHGWASFPAPPGEKKSHKSGQYTNGQRWGATADPAEIRRDHEFFPGSDLGIPTGRINNILVIDVDTMAGHPDLQQDGEVTLRQLEEAAGEKLSETLTAIDPSGGKKFIFEYPSDEELKEFGLIDIHDLVGKLGRDAGAPPTGLDIKAEGGMVIVPPSRNGGCRWGNDKPIAKLPRWFLQHIAERSRRPSSNNNERIEGSSRRVREAIREVKLITITAMLAGINPDIERGPWLEIGCACFRELGVIEGRTVWVSWSGQKGSKKYRAGKLSNQCAVQWRSIVKGDYNYHIETIAHYFKTMADRPEAYRQLMWEFEQKLDNGETYTQSLPDEADVCDDPELERQSQELSDLYQSGRADFFQEWLRRNNGQSNSDQSNSDQARDGGQAKSDAGQAKEQKKHWSAFIRRIDISNWDTEPVPEIEWVVPDRIPVDTTCLFSGEGAAGKSLTQMQLTVAKVLGREWLGVMPAAAPALFIDAEDPENIMHKRAVDVPQYYGTRFAEVKDQLHLVSWKGADSVLGFFSRKYSRIMPTPLFDQLLEMVGDLRPQLVGVASLANVFAGSEIDRIQVQQFISLLDRVAMRCHGSVVLISHPSLTGIGSESGLSGSTQWHNAVRSRMYLKKAKVGGGEQPLDSGLREIVFLKNNYGPDAVSITLRYHNGLFVPVEAANLDAMARLEVAKQVFLTLLRRLTRQNQDVHVSPGRGYAPSVFEPEQEARDAHLKKDHLAEAMRQLLKEGKITNASYKKGSHGHNRLVIATDVPDDVADNAF